MLNDLAESFPVLKSLQFSMLVVFVYDYLLTLPSEVELVWTRRFRISSAIYLIIRYLPVMNIIYAIIKSPIVNCDWVLPFMLSWVIVTRIAINATLIARVYAVCSHHRLLPSVVAAMGLSELILDCMLVTCTPPFKLQLAIVITRLLFEATVIIVTVVQTVRNFTLHNALDRRSPAGFILAHGIMYFIAVFLLEIMYIAVMKTQVRPEAQLAGSSGSYPLPVAAIFLARFHLDLRRMIQPSAGDGSTLTRSLPTMRFISHQVQVSFIDDFRVPDTSTLDHPQGNEHFSRG